jgi:hypothetical protein
MAMAMPIAAAIASASRQFVYARDPARGLRRKELLAHAMQPPVSTGCSSPSRRHPSTKPPGPDWQDCSIATARRMSHYALTTIIESEGDANALIEPVISAVSSVMVFPSWGPFPLGKEEPAG